MKGGNTYEKITHKAVHCNADIDIYSNNEHSGKGKDQIEQNKDLQRGKTYTLKVKGTKKKVKWSSNKKTIATVTRKGKVTAKKQGTAVITAKIGKKKYKCKVKVWQKTTKKPTKTNTESNPIGTRVNPADPRIGIRYNRRNCLLQTDRNFKGTRSRKPIITDESIIRRNQTRRI